MACSYRIGDRVDGIISGIDQIGYQVVQALLSPASAGEVSREALELRNSLRLFVNTEYSRVKERLEDVLGFFHDAKKYASRGQMRYTIEGWVGHPNEEGIVQALNAAQRLRATGFYEEAISVYTQVSIDADIYDGALIRRIARNAICANNFGHGLFMLQLSRSLYEKCGVGCSGTVDAEIDDLVRMIEADDLGKAKKTLSFITSENPYYELCAPVENASYELRTARAVAADLWKRWNGPAW